MPKLNIKLAKRLVTRFRRMRHKEHFNMRGIAQKTSCGTAMCIAGHALDLMGYKFHPGQPDRHKVEEWIKPNGQVLRARGPLGEATRLLGLTPSEAVRTGISTKDNGLFYRFDLRTPKQAANHIQKMIDEVQGSGPERPKSAAR